MNILKDIEKNSFNLVVCHNVFDYVSEQDRNYLINGLMAIVKSGGFLSIIKHNEHGKVNSIAVSESDPKKALEFYHGTVQNENDIFGTINYYDIYGLLKNIRCPYIIQKEYGIRIFFGNIADNTVKYNEKWGEEMFRIEFFLSDKKPYADIAFWKHYFVKKL